MDKLQEALDKAPKYSNFTRSMAIARKHCMPSEVYQNARVFLALNAFLES